MWQKGDAPIPGYRLEKFLGRGNFGEVWQASSPGGTKCALKFLNLHEKQGRKEFRAIQRLKQIRHANLLPINAMWMLDESRKVLPDDELESAGPLMEDSQRQTMVFTPGATEKTKPATLIMAMPLGQQNLLELLRERQQKGETIPPDELLVYMMDAARALDYLNLPQHDLGGGRVSVQHGDVKPENLLLLGGSVVLCDFGVARTLGGSAQTRATTMGGSLAYMAPECLTGKMSQHSDQFSLAISYVELRTGKLPFQDASVSQVIEGRKKGELKLDELTSHEQKVIRRAAALNPDKRFTSNVEMVEALKAALTGSAPAKSGNKWLAPVAIAAILCGIVVTLVVLQFGTGKTNGVVQRDGPGEVKPDGESTSRADEQNGSSGRSAGEPRAVDHLRTAMSLLASPDIGPSDIARATAEYVSAIEKGLPPELPTPVQHGIAASDLERVYSVPQQEEISQTVACDPASGRVFMVGKNGGSVVELLPGEESRELTLDFTSPIVSISWLDDEHLVVRNDDLELWLVPVDGVEQPSLIAEGVDRIATAPRAGKGIAVALREITVFTSEDRDQIAVDDREIFSPLVTIAPDGGWALVTEEFVHDAWGIVLELGESPRKRETNQLNVQAFCIDSVCLDGTCFGIVGGETAPDQSGLAVVSFVEGEPKIDYPNKGPDMVHDSGFREPRIRSLAMLSGAGRTAKQATLAVGQEGEGYLANTEMWTIGTDGSVDYLGTVGQPLESAITCLAFESSGRWLARGTEYGEIILTDIEGNADYVLVQENFNLTRVMQLQFVANRLVAAFSHGVTVFEWNMAECTMVIDACQQTGTDPAVPSLVNYEG